MERFDLTLVARGMECWQELSPAPDGDYCSYYAAEEERKILVSRIRALEEALANALQAQARFVPCSERLPERNGGYLTTDGRFTALLFWSGSDWHYAGNETSVVPKEMIRAWLDNLPPLDGSVRIKGE